VAASPLLVADATERAQQFAQLADIGAQAITRLGGPSSGSAEWKQTSLAALDAAQKQQGLVRFTVLEPLRELVSAVQ